MPDGKRVDTHSENQVTGSSPERPGQKPPGQDSASPIPGQIQKFVEEWRKIHGGNRYLSVTVGVPTVQPTGDSMSGVTAGVPDQKMDAAEPANAERESDSRFHHAREGQPVQKSVPQQPLSWAGYGPVTENSAVQTEKTAVRDHKPDGTTGHALTPERSVSKPQPETAGSDMPHNEGVLSYSPREELQPESIDAAEPEQKQTVVMEGNAGAAERREAPAPAGWNPQQPVDTVSSKQQEMRPKSTDAAAGAVPDAANHKTAQLSAESAEPDQKQAGVTEDNAGAAEGREMQALDERTLSAKTEAVSSSRQPGLHPKSADAAAVAGSDSVKPKTARLSAEPEKQLGDSVADLSGKREAPSTAGGVIQLSAVEDAGQAGRSKEVVLLGESLGGRQGSNGSAEEPAHEKLILKKEEQGSERTGTSAELKKDETVKPERAKPTEEEVLAVSQSKWKFKAVPFSEPDQMPPIVQRDEKFQGGRAVGARVRGKSHKHVGKDCDDWFDFAGVGNALIAAVADGAGSRRLSRVGAQAACRAAVESLKNELRPHIETNERQKTVLEGLSAPTETPEFKEWAGSIAEMLQQAAFSAIEAVRKAFEVRQDDPKYRAGNRELQFGDLGCTLLVLLAIPLIDGECFMASFQIGDGSIVSFDTKGPYPEKVRLLGEADSGEFSGQTEFITADRFGTPDGLYGRVKVSRGKNDLIMVMTDGVSDDYFPSETQMSELYYDLIANGILARPQDTAGNGVKSGDVLVPAPVEYPWVDNQDIKVALNYTGRICRQNNIDLKDLWDKRDLLAEAGRAIAAELGASDAERLARWLDNYVKRGSADDRTLVLLTLDGD